MAMASSQVVSELAKKWKNWRFAVRVHEGLEPEFTAEFSKLIDTNSTPSPPIVYRCSKNKIYQYAKIGTYIDQTSFITTCEKKEDMAYTDIKKGKTYLELETCGIPSLDLGDERVFQLGHRIFITKREDNQLYGQLVKC